MQKTLKSILLFIFGSRYRFSIFIGLLMLPLALMQVWLAFSYKNIFMGHDEAEHLFVVFALGRGEVPYRDFIENHPVLPHLLLLWIKNLLRIESAYSLYLLAKSLIWLHIAGCFFVVYKIFSVTYKKSEDSSVKPMIFLAALGTVTWLVGSYLWQVRPDWICFFYAIFSTLLFLWSRKEKDIFLSLVIVAGAGIVGGFATAFLPKTPYIFLPFVFWVSMLLIFIPGSVLKIDAPSPSRQMCLVAAYVIFWVVSYLVFLFVEIHFCRISLDDYVAANFKFNSKMHPPLNVVLNPLFAPAEFLGFNTVGFFAFVVCFIALIRSEVRTGRFSRFLCLLLCACVIFVNVVMPAYSNGITHSHYFIPTFLSIVFVFSIFLDRLFDFFWFKNGSEWISRNMLVGKGVAGLIFYLVRVITVVVMFVFIFNKYYVCINMADDYFFSKKIMKVGERIEDKEFFYPDKYYPDGLIHLSFFPHQKPVKDRIWGYYFMLGIDARVWRDLYQLNVSPNPDNYWKNLYKTNPPDVIQLWDIVDFRDWAARLRVANQVSIDWLLPVIPQNYTCMKTKGIQAQVRKGLEDRFIAKGWIYCDFFDESGKRI